MGARVRYLTNGTQPGSGMTVFEKADGAVRPIRGTLVAWDSMHADAEHYVTPVHPDEPGLRVSLHFGHMRGALAGSDKVSDWF